ncbi:hypothetical protein PF66_06395 [Pseudomonas asplenii]|uniref:Uncharacterized protein n=1 Tax=Pseudomonas asplenii TaxID=53407 RepID=A0A0M9GBK0_9PSED|nr:hypothetical protein [Pseudomonas fuscovaginae]KPA87050.1 hypothetical protein PF66_06395 [Pseudomonas fuscovaginae]
MDTNKMREQFEAAFIAQQVEAFGEYSRGGAIYRLKRNGDFDKPPTAYDLQRREQGMYDEYWIEMLWWAWRASREAVVVELPDVLEIGGPLGIRYFTEREVHSAIAAQGLKVAQ